MELFLFQHNHWTALQEVSTVGKEEEEEEEEEMVLVRQE